MFVLLCVFQNDIFYIRSNCQLEPAEFALYYEEHLQPATRYFSMEYVFALSACNYVCAQDFQCNAKPLQSCTSPLPQMIAFLQLFILYMRTLIRNAIEPTHV